VENHLLINKDFVACGDKSGRAIGGMFSVPLSVALGLSTCCARPLAGILLYGARTFLHAHEAHSGHDRLSRSVNLLSR
jgi:hypothetical protein